MAQPEAQPGQPGFKPVTTNFILRGSHIKSIGKLLKDGFDEPSFLPDDEGSDIIAEATMSYFIDKGIAIPPEAGLALSYACWLGPGIFAQLKKRQEDIAKAIARMTRSPQPVSSPPPAEATPQAV